MQNDTVETDMEIELPIVQLCWRVKWNENGKRVQIMGRVDRVL